MRWLFVLLVSLVLCAVASGAPGPIVPLAVPMGTSANLRITLRAIGVPGGDTVQASGTLPLVVPFNLSINGCVGFGTATLANVNGGLEIQISGGSLITPCNLLAEAELDEVVIEPVPDVGELVTPIYAQIAESNNSTGGIVFVDGFAFFGAEGGPAESAFFPPRGLIPPRA